MTAFLTEGSRSHLKNLDLNFMFNQELNLSTGGGSYFVPQVTCFRWL